MRVISGKFRGKKLFSPDENNVRPTTDRIKETLFNILYSKDGYYGKVLDLFSGSGALGIEALSRGAESAVFIDIDTRSVKLTRSNLQQVGATNYELYHNDYSSAAKKLAGRKFDVIFADPPYKLRIEPKIIDSIVENDLLEENGVLIIEHSTENKLHIDDKRFIIDERRCGNTVLTFLTYRRNDQ